MRRRIPVHSLVTAALIAGVLVATGVGIRGLIPGQEAEFDRMVWQRARSGFPGRRDIADILALTAPERGDWPAKLRALGFKETTSRAGRSNGPEGHRVFRKSYGFGSIPSAPRAGRVPASTPRASQEAFDAVVILPATDDGGASGVGMSAGIVAELRGPGY